MTLEAVRKIVEQDKETKHLTIEDVDLYKVYHYILDRDEGVEYDGYRPILKVTPYVEIVYVPTDAQQKKIRLQKMKMYLNYFESDVYIQQATFDTYNIDTKERALALEKAKTFLERYLNKQPTKGLYVYGPYGSGKSYLLSALANHFALNEINVLYVYMPDLVRSLKEGIQDQTLERRINILKQVNILMLDDLGGEFSSMWFRDEILMPVVQYRLSAELPLFVSSNYSLSELAEVLSISKDQEHRLKALRMIHRFQEMMDLIKLTEGFKKQN
jgi:primosomal protein DnaI